MTEVGGERGWDGGNKEFCARYMKFELPFRHLKWRCQVGNLIYKSGERSG